MTQGDSMRKKISSYAIYRQIFAYVTPCRMAFAIAIIGNILYGLVDVTLVKLLEPLLDKGFSAHDVEFIHWIPFVVFGMFFLRGIANFLANYYMGFVTRSIVMRLRQDTVEALLYRPADFFDQTPSGDLISKVIYDTEQVAYAGTEAAEVVVRQTCTALGLLWVMFSSSWRLTLLFIGLVPLMGFVMRVASRRLRFLNANVQSSMGKVTQITQEMIEGHREIKNYASQAHEKERFFQQTYYNRQQEMKAITTAAISVPLVQCIASVALAGTLYVATSFPWQDGHTFTAGAFASFVLAMMTIFQPIKQLTKVNSTIQRGLSGAASIFSFINARFPFEQTKHTEHPAPELSPKKPWIVFNRVSFSYPVAPLSSTGTHKELSKKSSHRLVLSDLSFSIQEGECVALVGESGSGKSSIIQLIPRFYHCTQGSIVIAGRRIEEWDVMALRRLMCLVSQKPFLFNASIQDNIRYGSWQASEEEIYAAAQKSDAHAFIEKMPQGYATMIGENGARLSGGQRQRIALARAFLKKSPILLLDEATSALDSASENNVYAGIAALRDEYQQEQGRPLTIIMITHRKSTLSFVDRVVSVHPHHEK